MITYRRSGVSIDAGEALVKRIRKIVSSSPASLSAIGGFSGFYRLPKKQGDILIAGCCDGVGTKLKIAFLLGRHDTVGIDLVAMNVNDLICSGSRPLFFLDYYACGKLELDIAEKVIRGIQKGCEISGCILLGGETAEMPGFYAKGEYDLAGFAVGVLDGPEESHTLNGRNIRAGDLILGIPSSGIHSNGYSLVRKIFSRRELLNLGDVLLEPTRIYVKEILHLLKSSGARPNQIVKGIAHITGGGWMDNIPRVFPAGVQAKIHKGGWEIPDIFYRIQARARISYSEMFRTFNMGIGLVLVIDKNSEGKVRKHIKDSVLLGEIVKGNKGVVFSS